MYSPSVIIFIGCIYCYDFNIGGDKEMSDIALINNDIIASEFGDILVIGDDDDIIQMAVNNILTVYGENPFHEEVGNSAYSKRHKMSEKSLQEIAKECMDAIMEDVRVQKVLDITVTNASTPTNIGRCSVSFELVTTSGKQLSSGLVIDIGM